MSKHSTLVRGTCHCGDVEIELQALPKSITECNCSLCRRTGVLWAYVDENLVITLPDASVTETYAWNGRHVDFHRCKCCGCITHWLPRDQGRKQRGVNARLFEPQALDGIVVVQKDGAA
jgi:hypothetical protein